MAFATGSQIRPELSAVDYTPFLQAAGQSAQMQAQGVGAIAKGLEDVVGRVTKAIQDRQAEENAVQLVKQFYPGVDDKTAKFGVKSAGGGPAFIKLMTDMERYKKSVEDEKKASEYFVNLQSGTADPTKYTPTQVAMGTKLFQDIVSGQLAAAKTGAEITNLGSSAARTAAEAEAIKQKAATEAKEEGIISGVLKELMPEPVAGVPEMLAKPKRQLNPNDLVSLAVQRGIRSEEGIRRISTLSNSLVKTREAGFESPAEAIASAPVKDIPFGYDVVPEQDRKSGRWFANVVQNPAAKSLGTDYYLTQDPKTGAPVARAVPGSAADVKLKDKDKKEEETKKTISFNIDSDRNNILRALWLLKNKKTGGMTAYLGYGPTVFNTEEQEFVRLVDSVRSAAGINHLMALKQSSPTGAGPLSTTSDKDFAAVIQSRLPYYATDRPANIEKGLTSVLDQLNNLSSKLGHTSVSYPEYEKQVYAQNREKAMSEGAIPMSSRDMVEQFGKSKSGGRR
jgi:hypothetical protein